MFEAKSLIYMEFSAKQAKKMALIVAPVRGSGRIKLSRIHAGSRGFFASCHYLCHYVSLRRENRDSHHLTAYSLSAKPSDLSPTIADLTQTDLPPAILRM